MIVAGVGCDGSLVYLTLWGGDAKLVKEMTPVETLQLAHSLMKASVPLLQRQPQPEKEI
jgi:hypothetical protein